MLKAFNKNLTGIKKLNVKTLKSKFYKANIIFEF